MDAFHPFGVFEFLAKLAVIIGFLGTPAILLWLHRRLSRLEGALRDREAPRAAPPAPAPARPHVPATPPMPVASSTRPAPAAATPNPLAQGLRRIGLLPPSDLKGEGALGAWITVRIGAALALAAAVFLGIWLNLRSTLPAWVRLGEVIALGGVIAGLGLRLRASRPDLGTVVTSLGLGILQFAAWASSGLERMQVIHNPVIGGLVQLATAAAIGILAIRLASSQLAQLSAGFLILSGLMVGRADQLALAQASHVVALTALGALSLWRRQWTTVAAVALGGATWLGFRLPADEPAVASGAALLTMLLLWPATQSLTHRKAWDSARARAGLTFGAVALPAMVLVASHPWDSGYARAWAGLGSAALCGLAGLRERQLGGRGELLLAFALVFAGAAGMWLLPSAWDWIPWVLAAAAAHALARASDSSLMEWTCDGLSFVATVLAASNKGDPGLAEILPAVGALSLLLGFRGSRLMAGGAWRAALPTVMLGLFLASRFVGSEIARDLKGLTWLLPVLAAILTRSALPALAAILPALLTQWMVWRTLLIGPENRHVAGLAWSLTLLVLQVGLVVLLSRRPAPVASRLVAGLTGLTILPLTFHLVLLTLPHHGYLHVCSWVLAAGVTLVTLHFLRLRALPTGAGPWLLLITALSAIPAAGDWMLTPHFLTPHYIAELTLWVAGIAAFLSLVAREAKVAAPHPALVSVTTAGFLIVGMTGSGRLPGWHATIVWLLTATLGFAFGHRGESRSMRLVSLAFLGLATLKLVALDITALEGRILACAVAAATFLGIAWAYGRRARPEGSKAGID